MIYLDNGATSFPKPKGMSMEMEDCIQNYCGNPGRSGHRMSLITGEQIYRARKAINSLIGGEDRGNIIFTKNATEAINMGIKGIIEPGDHIITTSMEHNSVLRPIKAMERKGITSTIVKGDKEGRIRVEDLEAALRPNTKLLVLTAAANTTGTLMPVIEAGRMAKKNHVTYMVDGSQYMGNHQIDVSRANIDLLAFPGHKALLGPMGTGGLYIKRGLKLTPMLEGGTGTASKSLEPEYDLPEILEGGTVNAPGIIGLGYSVEFIKKVGIDTIGFYERQLIERLDSALRQMKFVTVYGPQASEKSGITLFNINDVGSEEVTERLNREFGIAVRGGFHCAGLAHKTIGTWHIGAVRVSVGPFNQKRDIDRLIDGIWRIGKS